MRSTDHELISTKRFAVKSSYVPRRSRGFRARIEMLTKVNNLKRGAKEKKRLTDTGPRVKRVVNTVRPLRNLRTPRWKQSSDEVQVARKEQL